MLILSACYRPQPCDGKICGHGTCRVVEVSTTGKKTPLERYDHFRRIEVCDCHGRDGFEFRKVGCGPAAEYETCLPKQCKEFAERCGHDEACFSRGPVKSPECLPCPDGQVPDADHLRCTYKTCLAQSSACDDGLVCQEDGGCGPCPSDEIYDPETRSCTQCPADFAIVDGVCVPQPIDAYLVTKLKIPPANSTSVVGYLNSIGFFQKLWDDLTEEGYNLIWDQDLLLLFVFPELDDITPPEEPIETNLEIYDGRFVSTDTWFEVRGSDEPESLRDARRTVGFKNYLPGEPTGEACAKATAVDCNPGHFRGTDVLYSKVPSSLNCSPMLSDAKVRYSWDRLETIGENRMVLPYVKDQVLFQTSKVRWQFTRQPSGLCGKEASGTKAGWPCTMYVGHLRGALRAKELLDVILDKTGGGLTVDVIQGLLGSPDVDSDGRDGPDSYSVQIDLDLTPARYLPRFDPNAVGLSTTASPTTASATAGP
jgi:hypothetical protein